MKIGNGKMEWSELEPLFILDQVIGWTMFLLGAFWDGIAESFTLRHSTEGFPSAQVLWCAFWGLYLLTVNFYHKYYGK